MTYTQLIGKIITFVVAAVVVGAFVVYFLTAGCLICSFVTERLGWDYIPPLFSDCCRTEYRQDAVRGERIMLWLIGSTMILVATGKILDGISSLMENDSKQ